MTTTDTTTDHADNTGPEAEPLITSAMPEGARACGRCGVPVAPKDERGEVVADRAVRAMMTYPSGATVPRPGGKDTPAVTFSTCPACADRTVATARILRAHPALAARLGPAYAHDQLTAALDAFAMIGASLPADDMMRDAVLTRYVMDSMAIVGNAVQWTSAYHAREVTAGQCAAVPFAAATAEMRAAARVRVGGVLAYRVATTAPAVALPAPDRRPCMFCGVAAVEVPAHHVVALGGRDAARDAVWSPRTATPHTLGRSSAGGSREQIDGHLCRPCGRAAEHVGALGMTAMARALGEHLRGTGQEEAARALDLAAREETVTGLVGHAAIGGGPNSTPWAHVHLGDGLAPFTSSSSPRRSSPSSGTRAPARRTAARGGAR